MTKHFGFNKFIIGLLLFCGVFAHAFSTPATAATLMEGATMEAFCDTWDKNIADYSDQEHCWGCHIFLLFFDAANKTAGQINAALSNPLGDVINIGVGLFLIVQTLMLFSNVGDAPSPMEYLTKVGGMLVKAGFGWCFLKGGSAMAFEYIVNPVLTAAAQLSGDILDASGGGSVSCTMPSAMTVSKTLPMGTEVRASLKCMIEKIASGMAESQAVAQGLRCGAFFFNPFDWEDVGPLDFLGIPIPCPNPIMWGVGMLFGCMFWFISFMFPIAMMDVIFRIGLLVGMLPLFITAWIFPITSRYAKTAWNIFLHSCMVFAVTGIIISMTIAMLDNAWNGSDQGSMATFMSEMKSSAYVQAWNHLFSSGRGLFGLFMVLATTVWAIYVAPIADDLSGKFVGAEFSSNCAVKAVRGTLFFIIDIILMIITVITLGATSCLYLVRIMKNVAEGVEKAEKLRQRLEKIKKFRKRMMKIQQKAQQVKRNVQQAEAAFKGGQS